MPFGICLRRILLNVVSISASTLLPAQEKPAPSAPFGSTLIGENRGSQLLLDIRTSSTPCFTRSSGAIIRLRRSLGSDQSRVTYDTRDSSANAAIQSPHIPPRSRQRQNHSAVAQETYDLFPRGCGGCRVLYSVG